MYECTLEFHFSLALSVCVTRKDKSFEICHHAFKMPPSKIVPRYLGEPLKMVFERDLGLLMLFNGLICCLKHLVRNSAIKKSINMRVMYRTLHS